MNKSNICKELIKKYPNLKEYKVKGKSRIVQKY